MHALIIGGTGLISVGIVKSLLQRGATVSVINRGKRADTLPPEVERIVGDRNDAPAFAAALKGRHFDVVMDMVCFKAEQARDAVDTFAGRCGQFIFCSTVCTYGVKVPPGVLVDEQFPQEPISDYGRNKLLCEKIFLEADASGKFAATIIRPSCTYGPPHALIDNLEGNPVAWDRIERGLPVLCAGDGLGLWVATHRDDVGKLFAHATGNRKTFGQCYNATRPEIFTWQDFLRQAAAAIGKPAHVLYVPADMIVKRDRNRFGLLAEITRFHGAYDSSKARRDVPEFVCTIDFGAGAAETLWEYRQLRQWRSSADDPVYESIIADALRAGFSPVTLG